MKVNKFSRMYLVGMICILLSGFFPYFRYRFTIQDVETLKQGYPLLNLKKLATRKWKECFIPWFFQFPPLNALETRFPQPGFSTD